MRQALVKSVNDAILAASKLREEKALLFMQTAAEKIAECFNNDRKILIAGNGGSLCDAMHFAEEFTGFFREKRKPYPALVLSEAGHMSCVANDVGYDYVFSRGVEAFGQKGDIFISLTTSGNSQNLHLALLKAKERGLFTISFLGKTGGKMKGLSDLEWIVDGFPTSDRIQEAHMAAIHIIIEMVERLLSEKELSSKKTQMASCVQ